MCNEYLCFLRIELLLLLECRLLALKRVCFCVPLICNLFAFRPVLENQQKAELRRFNWPVNDLLRKVLVESFVLA